MKIVITKHCEQRARDRFKIKPQSLKKMARKVLNNGTTRYSNIKDTFTVRNGHLNFVLAQREDVFVVITVTNLAGIPKYKEKHSKPIYLQGKKTKHTMFYKDR